MCEHDCRLKAHEEERAKWGTERAQLEQQLDAVKANWQGRLEKALADAKQQQKASADTANLATAAQQHADHLQSSLE